MGKKVNLTEILGEEKSREEVMQEICNNSEVYLTFLNMPEVFREQFLQFCMGVRGMKMTYDTFFKHVFDAEVHPERLSNYQDMKKVYTIVFMENSSAEVKKIEGEYLHRGRWEFDSGLKLDLLTEFFFVSIDNFHKIEDNKEDTKEMSELEAWIYFIGSDKPEHILKIVEKYPWFAEYYEDVAYFRSHPKEAIGMFSDALRKLDENTVNYMIDDMKQELEKVKNEMKEKREQIKKAEEEIRKIEGEKQKAEQEKQKAKEEVTHIKEEMDKKMEEKDREIEELRKMLANK